MSGPRLRGIAREAGVLLFFAALAAGHTRVTSRLASDLFAHIDPLQDAWILVNVTDNLWRRPADLFEGNNYFPSRDAILFCDPLLLPAAVRGRRRRARYAIHRGARLDRVVRRRFRDDQLRDPVRFRFRAAGPAQVRVSVNDGASHPIDLVAGVELVDVDP